jgi:hypothetical protein
MSDWFSARTIVEDDKVQTAADGYSREFSRFNDLWESLKWLLARKGHELQCLRRTESGQEFFLYKTAEAEKGVPSITVVYTINENEIRIHGVKAEYGQAKQKTTVTEIRRGS